MLELPIEEVLKRNSRLRADWINNLIGTYKGTKEQKQAFREALAEQNELIECYIILRFIKWYIWQI